MEDIVKLYLLSFFDTVDQESIDQFKTIFTEKTAKKGETLVRHGQTCNYFYIIKKGFVASFVSNKKGDDFIRTIYKPADALSSLTSLIKNEPSNANYNCLTDCELIQACFNDFTELAKNNTLFPLLYTKVIEDKYFQCEERIHELSALNATERYTSLQKTFQNIDNILPQYQIAQYLNITPVQLSRIRRSLLKKK